MKKIFISLALVFVSVFSLTAPSFAENNTHDYKVTEKTVFFVDEMSEGWGYALLGDKWICGYETDIWEKQEQFYNNGVFDDNVTPHFANGEDWGYALLGNKWICGYEADIWEKQEQFYADSDLNSVNMEEIPDCEGGHLLMGSTLDTFSIRTDHTAYIPAVGSVLCYVTKNYETKEWHCIVSSCSYVRVETNQVGSDVHSISYPH